MQNGRAGTRLHEGPQKGEYYNIHHTATHTKSVSHYIQPAVIKTRPATIVGTWYGCGGCGVLGVPRLIESQQEEGGEREKETCFTRPRISD